MATDIPHDLQEFHSFLGETLASGRGDLSPEEALDEWRILHPAPAELAESVAAVRRALRDMQSGDRGRPADAVLSDIRQRLLRASQS
ncbi:MAG: hypothetical protein K8T91_04185 [Planctomycetes bacterium]|nr:hypothetical protein [Planctomycetota bacterium]